ncbi:hypothetical protein EG68_09185 [Paragonimus skrjabini miyazakii]|uniref:Uncharacterized protein n=1 Tax=Paragonimus skrjabini miyazakii TaxID=59628 RepID=A0A8S9YGU6_9TREM|nr:hypothetical protein EG68_09185 [Paragonimus skrjabini miyazakii]
MKLFTALLIGYLLAFVNSDSNHYPHSRRFSKMFPWSNRKGTILNATKSYFNATTIAPLGRRERNKVAPLIESDWNSTDNTGNRTEITEPPSDVTESSSYCTTTADLRRLADRLVRNTLFLSSDLHKLTNRVRQLDKNLKSIYASVIELLFYQ